MRALIVPAISSTLWLYVSIQRYGRSILHIIDASLFPPVAFALFAFILTNGCCNVAVVIMTEKVGVCHTAIARLDGHTAPIHIRVKRNANLLHRNQIGNYQFYGYHQTSWMKNHRTYQTRFGCYSTTPQHAHPTGSISRQHYLQEHP